MKAIYLKEMRSYFHSLAAYIYFALFIAATGVYFSVICMSYGYTDYAQYVFSNSTILYIVIVPILTMRLFAEAENRSALIYFPNSLWQYCIWKVSCIRNITCYFYVSKHHRGRCIKYVWKRKLEDRSYRLSWIFLIRSLPDGGRNVCLLSY